MIVGVGADHGGFEMKSEIAKLLVAEGHQVVDFGNKVYDAADDYPDFAIPLARAVAHGHVEHRRLAKVLNLEESRMASVGDRN